ncbi:hypothetical protein CLAIMM_14217 [Cladophialophora immunda]|nr:hypothetical protein CLAIMM_14217 [Cladophialophora immunda]
MIAMDTPLAPAVPFAKNIAVNVYLEELTLKRYVINPDGPIHSPSFYIEVHSRLTGLPNQVTSPSAAQWMHSAQAAYAPEEQQSPTSAGSPASTPSLILDTANDHESPRFTDYLTIDAVNADQQAAYARTNGPSQAALHFHPQISPPILGFDPRVIQDDFDPFNLDLFAFQPNRK